MKNLLTVVVFSLLVLGCRGPAGSDGAMGPQGVAGSKGAKGGPGSDGKDGVDGKETKIVKQIYCSGVLEGGYWDDVKIIWDANVMSTGDVFVAGFVENLGSFNVSGTVFYSAKQVGAIDGYIGMYIDNYNFVSMEYNPNTDGIKVKFAGSNPATYVDSSEDACISRFF